MSEEKTQKTQSFLKGTIILTSSVILVKLIGALFKIPLNIILGGVGVGYFSAAYELYNPLESLATAGFPIAISRLVSEYMEKKSYKNVRLIHKISIPLFFFTGSLGFLVMVACSFLYVNTAGAPAAIYSTLALAPTVLFVCLMSIYRGYYQGLRNMTPTAVSEVIEASCKLIIGLSLACLFSKFSQNANRQSFSAAGAILGVTFGAIISFVYLLIRHRKIGDGITAEYLRNSQDSISVKLMFKRLIAIAIPVGLGSIVMSFAGLVDSTLILRRINDIMIKNPQALLEMYGRDIPSDAVIGNNVNSYLYGCFGYVTTITMIIPSITQVFGVSALPTVTAAWVSGDKKRLKNGIESVLRLTSIVTIHCGLVIAILGRSIMKFIYESPRTISETNIAAGITTMMGIAAIFTSMSTPICSMLQAVGRVDLPVKLLSFGVIIKIILNYILVGIPEINIQGAGTGTFFCYLFVTVVALYSLLKETKIKINFKKIFLKPIFASFVSCILCKITEILLRNILPNRLLTGILLAFCIIIYFSILFAMKTITKNDFSKLSFANKTT